MKMETIFETGATTQDINNYILSADNTKEFCFKLREIQQVIFIFNRDGVLDDINKLFCISKLAFLIERFNGKLEQVKHLYDYEMVEVVQYYYNEAINSIKEDLF